MEFKLSKEKAYVRQMANIKDFAEMPKVTVNEKEFVDREIFVSYAQRQIDQEIKAEEDERVRTGMEIAMQIFRTLK